MLARLSCALDAMRVKSKMKHEPDYSNSQSDRNKQQRHFESRSTTLSRSSGIAMHHNQYLRRLSHAVIRGSADAVLDVLRRNF